VVVVDKISPIRQSFSRESPDLIRESQRIALVIQYIGTRLHGWQWQPNARTVQGEIEQTIASILGRSARLTGAGRTDAGVHAAAQMAHFDAPKMIPPHRWAEIISSRVADDILVRASACVPHHWHAQFSAKWRRYRYSLYTGKRPNLFIRPFVWHYYHKGLDAARMQAALAPMVGQHDMAAFQRAGSGRAHSRVDLQVAECHRRGDFLTVELQASGFLYGMVRLIMGLLVKVGNGELSLAEFQQIWQSGERHRVKYSAPAKGLCLLRVGYDDFPFAKAVWFDAQPQFYLDSMMA
jgi:tRNA pseudouridine38-40 synthase